MKTVAPVLTALCMAFGLDALAKTNYVNNGMADYTGHNGSTPELAYRKIQEGISNASDGDTVMVAPGVYGEDQGLGRTSSHWWWNSRILIANKSIHIRSSGGADKTFIVGRHDPEGEGGYGTNAVRCICVENTNNDKEIVFQGFTLCDGATRGDKSGHPAAAGGALLCSDQGYTGLRSTWIVDCVITNCIGADSQIALGGIFVRCRIEDNDFRVAPSKDTAGNPVVFGEKTSFLNCLIRHNRRISRTTGELETSSITMPSGTRFVNCTFADNLGRPWFNDTCYLHNVMFSSTRYDGHGSGTAAQTHGTLYDSTDVRYLISPTTGDVRVRAGTAAATGGDAAYVTDESSIPLPTLFEVDRFRDLDGHPIPREGAICVGCRQETVVPAGGCLIADSNSIVFDDRPSTTYAASYAYPVTYPMSFHVRVNGSTSGARAHYYNLTGSGTGESSRRYPDRTDDAIWVTPPPDRDAALKVSGGRTTNIVYADANSTEEETVQNGSPEHPFDTLQKAVDALPAGGGIVIARKGVYDKGYGERTWTGEGVTLKARVYYAEKLVRLISEEGPEKTFIVGAPDPTSADGNGTGATLLLAMNSSACIQGFTLTGGYSGVGLWTGSGRGPIYSYGTDLHVADCIITNNHGRLYAVGSGRFDRCYIAGNTGGAGILMGSKLVSCVVGPNEVTNDGGIFLDDNGDFPGYVINTTVVGDGVHRTWGGSNNAAKRLNAVFDVGSDQAYLSGKAAGCVYNGRANLKSASGYACADPMLVDRTAGAEGCRLFSGSPALVSAVSPSADPTGVWWFLCTTDYTGAPWSYDAQGRPVSGAWQDSVSGGLYVCGGSGGVRVVSGGKIGLNDGLSEGDEVVVGLADGSVRPVAGFIVDGVTNVFEGSVRTLTVVRSAGASQTVVPYYTSDWYVDAVNGSDTGNFGYNAACAFKTLEKALRNPALRSGDRVVALPGTYAEGTMIQSEKAVTRARGVVPSGVTLSSRDGAATTFIRGAAAEVDDISTNENYNRNMSGLGKTAIRGIYLSDSTACVTGFTFTNCFTRGAKDDRSGGHNSVDHCGGGVCGSGRAENCVFTCCKAFRGGGTFLTVAVNCVFDGNHSLYGGGASTDAYQYGCLSRNNTCVENDCWKGFFFWLACENCTVLDSISSPRDATTVLRNTLVLGPMCTSYMSGRTSDQFVNCAFASGVEGAVGSSSYRPCIEAGPGVVIVPPAELAVDAEGRPVIGSSRAVDAGNAAVNSAYIGETDLFGGQRVYNKVMDIGALEGDWRPVYAKDVRRNRFGVTAASPDVFETQAKTVSLSDGAALAAVLSAADGRDYSLRAKVTGSGALSVRVNGAETVYGAGEVILRIENVTAEQSLDFAYAGEGSAELLGLRCDAGAIIFVR